MRGAETYFVLCILNASKLRLHRQVALTNTPANAIHRANIGSLLPYRLILWPNINLILGQCIVFARTPGPSKLKRPSRPQVSYQDCICLRMCSSRHDDRNSRCYTSDHWSPLCPVQGCNKSRDTNWSLFDQYRWQSNLVENNIFEFISDSIAKYIWLNNNRLQATIFTFWSTLSCVSLTRRTNSRA